MMSVIADKGEEWREDSGEAVCGVLYKAADGSEQVARADLSIICDGMYSSLRSKLSVPNIRQPSFFVGLVLRDAALPYRNYGHVVLAKPSPILFYPISSTEVGALPPCIRVQFSSLYSSCMPCDMLRYLIHRLLN
jgi:squalene monooxygenase